METRTSCTKGNKPLLSEIDPQLITRYEYILRNYKDYPLPEEIDPQLITRYEYMLRNYKDYVAISPQQKKPIHK